MMLPFLLRCSTSLYETILSQKKNMVLLNLEKSQFQLQNFWHSEESHHLSLPPSFPLNYEDNRYNPFHLLHYKFGMSHCIMKAKDYISKCQ